MTERVDVDDLPFDHMALTVVPCDECDLLAAPYEATLNVPKDEVIGISSVESFGLACGHEVSVDYLRENYES